MENITKSDSNFAIIFGAGMSLSVDIDIKEKIS